MSNNTVPDVRPKHVRGYLVVRNLTFEVKSIHLVHLLNDGQMYLLRSVVETILMSLMTFTGGEIGSLGRSQLLPSRGAFLDCLWLLEGVNEPWDGEGSFLFNDWGVTSFSWSMPPQATGIKYMNGEERELLLLKFCHFFYIMLLPFICAFYSLLI